VFALACLDPIFYLKEEEAPKRLPPPLFLPRQKDAEYEGRLSGERGLFAHLHPQGISANLLRLRNPPGYRKPDRQIRVSGPTT